MEELSELISDELNIKEVVITQDEEQLVNLNAKANFKTLGRKLGKKMKIAGNLAANTLDMITDFVNTGLSINKLD